MLESFLAIGVIYVYFLIQAIRLFLWFPKAFHQLKRGETSFSIPFTNAVLWALFSFVVLINSLDALRDQPCWILCDLDANVRLVIRFITVYGISNVFLFILIGIAFWQNRINQNNLSTRPTPSDKNYSE